MLHNGKIPFGDESRTCLCQKHDLNTRNTAPTAASTVQSTDRKTAGLTDVSWNKLSKSMETLVVVAKMKINY